MNPLSPSKLLPQLLASLSEVVSGQFPSHPAKPDMRSTRSRKLKAVCHSSHVTQRYERSSRKFGNWRFFTTGAFAQALTLPDKEFNKLITTLATLKKFNQ